MKGLGFVLIVACLVGDMATPLCPGAFRFDPAQSIQVVGSRAVASLSPDLKAPSLPRREALEIHAPVLPRSVAGALMAACLSRPSRRRAGLVPAHPDLDSPRRSEDSSSMRWRITSACCRGSSSTTSAACSDGI
jgi:hypothetical protein